MFIGTKEEHFAKIAYKNHLHSINNPKSQFQQKYTLEQIKSSPMVAFPLTKLQCWYESACAYMYVCVCVSILCMLFECFISPASHINSTTNPSFSLTIPPNDFH